MAFSFLRALANSLPVFSLVGFFVHREWRLASGTTPEEDADEHGDNGYGHDQRGYQREGDRQRERDEELGDYSADEGQR